MTAVVDRSTSVSDPRRAVALVRRAVLLAVAAGAVALPARAATPLPEYPWLRTGAALGAVGDLDLAALAPTAGRLETLRNESFGYVDLLWRMTVHLHADGTVSERALQVRRFLTASGAEEGGDMGFLASPQYEVATVERALVLGADGAVVPLDPATIQVVPRQEPRIFTDVREVIVPLPAARPGSTAVLATEHRVTPPDFMRPWSAGFVLRALVPFERYEVVVSWDAGVAAPRWATTDPSLACVNDGERRIACRTGPTPPFALDPDLADFYDLIPQLLFSQVPNWTGLAGSMAALFDRQAQAADAGATARRLTAAARTPRERVDALYRFVADEVRYVALEHGAGSMVPRPPATTLHNRFGDCKDKVVLFLALARAVGLDAHAVVTSTTRHNLAGLLLPSGMYFNHVIACVRGAEAEEVCVDPTLPNAAAGDLGGALQGAIALDLRRDTPAPRQLPAARYGSAVEIAGAITARCDGSIEESLSRAYSGSAALTLRATLDGSRPDDRRRWLEDEFRAAVGRDVHPGFTVRGLDGPHADVLVESTATYEPGQPLREVRHYSDGDVWLAAYGLALRSENRHHPVRLLGMRYRSVLRFELCDAVEPRFLGPELDFQSSFGSLRRRYERAPAGVTVETTLEVPAATVDAPQVERFNRFLERSIQQSAIWFSLDPRD